ncbi:MAG: LysE family transporter [Limisphaerales bacterium]
MLQNYPFLEAFLTGLISGFLVSIPVGPINVTIIHEGAERGFRWACFIGAGSVLMEAIYCAIGFAGFSELFTTNVARAILQLASFALMSYLGVKYLFAKEVKTTSRSAERIEDRFHPHTAFMTGFVRTLGNPGVLLLWVALSATFLSHEWVDPNWTSKSICIGGVAAGGLAWFTLLSYVVSIGHRHLSDKTMLNMSRGAGGMMLVAAVALGYKLALLLADTLKAVGASRM